LTTEVGVKPTPVIVTTVPGAPAAGETFVSESVGVKVEPSALPTGVVTATTPADEPSGTLAVIFVGTRRCTRSRAFLRM